MVYLGGVKHEFSHLTNLFFVFEDSSGSRMVHLLSLLFRHNDMVREIVITVPHHKYGDFCRASWYIHVLLIPKKNVGIVFNVFVITERSFLQDSVLDLIFFEVWLVNFIPNSARSTLSSGFTPAYRLTKSNSFNV